MKHEKFLYTQVLSEICHLKTEDQYSLHDEFSEIATQEEREAVAKMIQFIEERGNPFDVSSTDMKNLSSGKQLDPKLVDFRVKCTTKREEKYQQFKEERLEKKSAKLFDLIPKLEMENGSKQEKKRKIDVNKLTVEFMHQADIARTRNYDLRELLRHELISTSLHLTKDRLLRKSPKSELAHVLKHHVSDIPTEVPSVGEMQSVLVIDFMTYCRKVPIKKLCLNTYVDFSKHLFSKRFSKHFFVFQNIFQISQRIDIVFDLYLDQSFKQGE